MTQVIRFASRVRLLPVGGTDAGHAQANGRLAP